MPKAPPKWCPSCRVAHPGRCSVARQQRQAWLDSHRGSSAQRGYDAAWRRCRSQYLIDHPLCMDCEAVGRLTQAQEVHHIRALARCGARLDAANLMALCKACHSRRTARGE